MDDLKGSEIYRRLQQHLDEKTIGFPSTKSGVDIKILKYLFTEEEAKIALYLNFSWHNLESVEKIYERAKNLGYTIEELKIKLNNMAQKGAIMAFLSGKQNTYGLANFIIGMSDYQMDKWTKGFFIDCTQYLHEAYINQISKLPLTQTRFIPVNEAIVPNQGILDYDNIKIILKNVEGPFCIANCVCRQGNDLLDNPCKKTDRRETCISFGIAAERYIEKGWAKKISKEEAIDALKKSSEEGLIHQVSNAKRLDFICSCCECCCEAIKLLKNLPVPGLIVNSNYYAQTQSDQCSGCETCIDWCQMNAIKVINQKAKINKKRCIGCGNCLIKCPSNAIILIKKQKLKEPLDNGEILYQEILKNKRT